MVKDMPRPTANAFLIGSEFRLIRFAFSRAIPIKFRSDGAPMLRAAPIIGGNALGWRPTEIIAKAKDSGRDPCSKSSADDLGFHEGIFKSPGPTFRQPQDIATRISIRRGFRRSLATGLEASAFFTAEPPAFPNGCHICEVEIDPATGE